MFNKKNRIIAEQKRAIKDLQGRIIDLEQSLKESKCYIRELQIKLEEATESKIRLATSLAKMADESDKILNQNSAMKDWIKDCPDFCE